MDYRGFLWWLLRNRFSRESWTKSTPQQGLNLAVISSGWEDWFAKECKEAELGHEIEEQPKQLGGYNTYMKFLEHPLKLIHKVYHLKLICVDQNKLWKVLKETGIPGHLTCLLRNLYVGQEATVRTLFGTNDQFKIKKREWQGCLLSPCLFNLYSEHIMRNARLDELHARIKIGRRNINNLRHVDDITLMAETQEELKSLLMRVMRESERANIKAKY